MAAWNVIQTQMKSRQAYILVADDNVINRKLAVRQLERLGCQVEIAASGREAVTLAEATAFDAILMDCAMPEWTAAKPRALFGGGEQETDRYTPILGFTASESAQMQSDCRAAGMDGFVAKPVERQALATRLLDVLAQTLPPAAGNNGKMSVTYVEMVAKQDEPAVSEIFESELTLMALACSPAFKGIASF